MSAFQKHVNETDNYKFEFKNVINTDGGESISSATVEVVKREEDSDGVVSFSDKTSEFGSLGISIQSDTQVIFTLNARTSTDEQEDSPYIVYCEITTSDSRVLVDTNGLVVYKTGDKDD